MKKKCSQMPYNLNVRIPLFFFWHSFTACKKTILNQLSKNLTQQYITMVHSNYECFLFKRRS